MIKLLYGRYLMSFLINDSFYDKANAIANLGDNIQSIAMDSIYQQLLISSKDIRYIKRDFGDQYQGDSVNLVLYTEFAKENVARRMRLSKDINIKGIMSSVFYDSFEVLEKVYPNLKSTLKGFEPIGARDERTKEYLLKEGIRAYLTGCFTVCFPRRKTKPLKEKVFFVDTPEELEPFIPDKIRENSEYLSHAIPIMKYPVDKNENQRLDEQARQLLKRYEMEATLVVTGRLHAAIPCLAFGIPVILTCNNLDFRFGWVEKFIRPYQLGEYDQINWSPAPVDIEDLKRVMIRYFDNALKGESTDAELKWIDNYYSARDRVPTHLACRKLIAALDGLHGKDNDFCYAIWGAGFHCDCTYQLVSEQFPKARLVAVVDKYKTGEFHGAPIIKASELNPSEIAHLFITTVPGKADALHWIEQTAPELAYTINCSQQKS